MILFTLHSPYHKKERLFRQNEIDGRKFPQNIISNNFFVSTLFLGHLNKQTLGAIFVGSDS